MCGIAGIYAYHHAATEVDHDELITIRDNMRARGPDDSGQWYSADNMVGLAHRRLAIIDPGPGGHQPMKTRCGHQVITYNGEIYNFAELRAQLQRAGFQFDTWSDTEVLLALYQQKGATMVDELRGMFALAIWDSEKSALFLARDPYGIKPLYYCDDGLNFRFASQVKALVSGNRVCRHIDVAAEAGFLLFGSIPEPHTMYSAIRALPAGSSLWVSQSGVEEPQRYFAIGQQWAESDGGSSYHSSRPGSVAAEVAAQAFSQSVHHHLVSDVPVGTFLSAGIDSGALTGLMSEQMTAPVRSITLAFREFEGEPGDERMAARQVAKHYGTTHTERLVGYAEFCADLPQILEAMDQPSIDGINTWFISKAAAEQGIKVMISGLGGDELLGGYPAFQQLPGWVRQMRLVSAIPLLGDMVQMALHRFPHLSNSPKAAGLVKYGGNLAGAYLLKRGLFMPWELPELMGRERAAEGLAGFDPVEHIRQFLPARQAGSFAAISSLESSLYMRNQLLRDTDWASMAHSVEVRTPLVDINLLRQLAPLLSGLPAVASEPSPGKRWLASAPVRPLPATVISRAKTGFTTPIAGWLQQGTVLDRWRSVSNLAHPKCHWSRRFAYSLHQLTFCR